MVPGLCAQRHERQSDPPGHDIGGFFVGFTGIAADGVALKFGLGDVGIFVLIAFALNFIFIYRGISKGIEKVCVYAMPVLIGIAFIILLRVLTLGTPDPAKPDQSLVNGLGYMWNPGDIRAGLLNPQLWLAAAGQIFFSLSVGFGVIITYASYLRRNDDVVLSGLTATAANEFCEVGLGGLITVPAAFVFLGAAGVPARARSALASTSCRRSLPGCPAASFRLHLFILLFLAAITSSLSMLQPGIAFLEEPRPHAQGVGGPARLHHRPRRPLRLVLLQGPQGARHLRFLGRTVLIFLQGTVVVILFGWFSGSTVGSPKPTAVRSCASPTSSSSF